MGTRMSVDARETASSLAMQLLARNALLGRHLFPIGPWEILLNLMAEARPVQIDELAAALGSTRSTTSRWLQVLQDEGLVERVGGALRHEAGFELSSSGEAAMERVLGG